MHMYTHTKCINAIRNKIIKILNKIQFYVTQFNLSGRLQAKGEEKIQKYSTKIQNEITKVHR